MSYVLRLDTSPIIRFKCITWRLIVSIIIPLDKLSVWHSFWTMNACFIYMTFIHLKIIISNSSEESIWDDTVNIHWNKIILWVGIDSVTSNNNVLIFNLLRPTCTLYSYCSGWRQCNYFDVSEWKDIYVLRERKLNKWMEM